MKSEVYGLVNLAFPYGPSHPSYRGVGEIRDEINKFVGIGQRINAAQDYKEKRANGDDTTNPSRPFPCDGDAEWVEELQLTDDDLKGQTPRQYFWSVKYTAGPRDRQWMQEKDRLYLTQLADEVSDLLLGGAADQVDDSNVSIIQIRQLLESLASQIATYNFDIYDRVERQLLDARERLPALLASNSVASSGGAAAAAAAAGFVEKKSAEIIAPSFEVVTGKAEDFLYKFLTISDSTLKPAQQLLLKIDSDPSAHRKGFMDVIGVDFKIKTISIDNQIFKLRFWDTGGQERFRTMTSSYYRGSSGVLFVYNSGNKASFDYAENQIRNFKSYGPPNSKGILIAYKGNQDANAVSYDQGFRLAEKNSLLFFEVLADNANDVNRMLYFLTRYIYESEKEGVDFEALKSEIQNTVRSMQISEQAVDTSPARHSPIDAASAETLKAQHEAEDREFFALFEDPKRQDQQISELDAILKSSTGYDAVREGIQADLDELESESVCADSKLQATIEELALEKIHAKQVRLEAALAQVQKQLSELHAQAGPKYEILNHQTTNFLEQRKIQQSAPMRLFYNATQQSLIVAICARLGAVLSKLRKDQIAADTDLMLHACAVVMNEHKISHPIDNVVPIGTPAAVTTSGKEEEDDSNISVITEYTQAMLVAEFIARRVTQAFEKKLVSNLNPIILIASGHKAAEMVLASLEKSDSLQFPMLTDQLNKEKDFLFSEELEKVHLLQQELPAHNSAVEDAAAAAARASEERDDYDAEVITDQDLYAYRSPSERLFDSLERPDSKEKSEHARGLTGIQNSLLIRQHAYLMLDCDALRSTADKIENAELKKSTLDRINDIEEKVMNFNSDLKDPIIREVALLEMLDLIRRVAAGLSEEGARSSANARCKVVVDEIYHSIMRTYSDAENILKPPLEPLPPKIKRYIRSHRLRLEQELLLGETNLALAFKHVLSAIKIKGFDHMPPKGVFIYYAWPDNKDEQQKHLNWVQPFLIGLRAHLEAAGLYVRLDIKDNSGDNIYDYMKGARTSEFVILVGTESLLKKHEGGTSAVCNELIEIKRARAQQGNAKFKLCPILISGTIETAFPPQYELYTTIRNWKDDTKTYYHHIRWLIECLYSTGEGAFVEEWDGFLKQITDDERLVLTNGLNKDSVAKHLVAEQDLSEQKASQQYRASEELLHKLLQAKVCEPMQLIRDPSRSPLMLNSYRLFSCQMPLRQSRLTSSTHTADIDESRSAGRMEMLD